MSVIDEFDPHAPVDPDDWVILRPFSHQGTTYGRNERVPDTLGGDELFGLLKGGVLLHRTSEGVLERPPLPKPDSPAAYLRLADSAVLRAIREHQPSPEDMQHIAALARRNRRSVLLVDALEVMAGVPLAPPQPRGAPGQPPGDFHRLQADYRTSVDHLEDERRRHGQLRTEHATLQEEHSKLRQENAALLEKHKQQTS